MRKKYIVYPGFVESKYDRQRHFIDAKKLIDLYKVDPREGIVADPKKTNSDGFKQRQLHQSSTTVSWQLSRTS